MPSPKCPKQQHSIRYYTRLCLGGAGVLLSTGDIQDLKLVKSACIETALPGLVGWDHALKPMPSDVHTALVNQVSLCSSAAPACIPPPDTTTKNLSKKLTCPPKKNNRITQIKNTTKSLQVRLSKDSCENRPPPRRGEMSVFRIGKTREANTCVHSVTSHNGRQCSCIY